MAAVAMPEQKTLNPSILAKVQPFLKSTFLNARLLTRNRTKIKEKASTKVIR